MKIRLIIYMYECMYRVKVNFYTELPIKSSQTQQLFSLRGSAKSIPL